MPTIKKFDSSRVLVYFGDHPPPHAHVKLSDGRDCTVELGNFPIKGNIAEREIKEALAWIRENQGLLYEEWKRCNP